MCRNIRTLYNYQPPATDQEVRAAALQFVRKVSGYRSPSVANEEAFERAIAAVALATAALMGELTTPAAPRNREIDAERARERAKKRYGRT